MLTCCMKYCSLASGEAGNSSFFTVSIAARSSTSVMLRGPSDAVDAAADAACCDAADLSTFFLSLPNELSDQRTLAKRCKKYGDARSFLRKAASVRRLLSK